MMTQIEFTLQWFMLRPTDCRQFHHAEAHLRTKWNIATKNEPKYQDFKDPKRTLRMLEVQGFLQKPTKGFFVYIPPN